MSQTDEARLLVRSLNATEHQFVELCARGVSIRGIADALSMTVEEATSTKASLMKKLGANVTADIVRTCLLAQID